MPSGQKLGSDLAGLAVRRRIEAYCIWITEDRAGFQFERIIRLDDFVAMIEELQPNPRLRRKG